MQTFPYRRIIVIGVTSAGKSTLAETLAQKLGLDFIELDALHWEPNWVDAPDAVFRQRVEAAISAPAWALAGNYSVVRDLTWPRAEAVIWLDYPLPAVFWRLLTRTLRRWWTRELLWGTNRENLWNHLKLWSDESLFHWLFKTYWRRKRQIPHFLSQPEYAHLKLFHFKSPSETQNWVKSIT
ncbi:MAG TPA: adenylate kinase [Anaerolineae bacterium]|jgi:adenylate kinase family enzyme|nr:adenylate kinase [Anaerolineae bacterium]